MQMYTYLVQSKIADYYKKIRLKLGVKLNWTSSLQKFHILPHLFKQHKSAIDSYNVQPLGPVE